MKRKNAIIIGIVCVAVVLLGMGKYQKNKPQKVAIWSYEKNEEIMKIVEVYQETASGEKVQISYEWEENEKQYPKLSDYRDKLKAYDVVMLDGVSFTNAELGNYFADLSSFLAKKNEKGEYVQNIITSYQTENGCFVLPTAFTGFFAVSDKKLESYIASLEKTANFIERNKDIQAMVPFYFVSPNDEKLVEELLRVYGNMLYGEKSTLDEKNVEAYLTYVKSIYSRTNEYEGEKDIYGTYIAQDANVYVEREKEGSFAFNPFALYNRAYQVIATPLHKENMAVVPMTQFRPEGLLAIVKESKNKKEAEEFIHFMLSGKVQSEYVKTTPVLKEPMEIFLNEEVSFMNETFGESYPISAYGDYLFYSLTEENCEWFMKQITEFKVPMSDGELQELEEQVMEETILYCKEQISLEEAVEKIVQKNRE